MGGILVRPASKGGMSSGTFDSNRFAEQISGINEVTVAELQGELVGMLHLCFLWPGHEGGTVFKQQKERELGRSKFRQIPWAFVARMGPKIKTGRGR